MHEQHPDFFKQYRKSFRYFVFEKEPKVGEDIPADSNYAFGIHVPSSDHFCGFEQQPHYHALVQCGESEKRKGLNIPCLYSTFCLLIADCINFQYHGEIINRLRLRSSTTQRKTETYSHKEGGRYHWYRFDETSVFKLV